MEMMKGNQRLHGASWIQFSAAYVYVRQTWFRPVVPMFLPSFVMVSLALRTYEDRLNTISNVREAGISVCCGGILGLGEVRFVAMQ